MTEPMTEKSKLQRYLQIGRDALVWKLDGVDEYDVRRPLTPTGTNLLGVLKHVATVQACYLGDCFGRPFPEPLPWIGPDSEDNADMWATAVQSRDDILGLFDRSNAHADATIGELDLTDTGTVPWWGEMGAAVTLQHIIVHLIAELHRHAGHLDILREQLDGAAGLREDNDNLPPLDAGAWQAHRDRLDAVARQVAGANPSNG